MAEGPLAGGNLTTLCHLVGTPFAPQLEGYLLFLEDHNEALYRLDRMLHHLLLAGVLEGVKGVVLGAFTDCGSTEGLLEVFTAALAPLGVPVLAGLPVGHQPDNHTLPLGAWARLDSGAGQPHLGCLRGWQGLSYRSYFSDYPGLSGIFLKKVPRWGELLAGFKLSRLCRLIPSPG